MGDKKYVLLSTDEYYVASGNAHETTGAGIIDKLPRVVYTYLYDIYHAKVHDINNISLCKDVSFVCSHNDIFRYGNNFSLPQLSGRDNSKGRGIYEVDCGTAELLEGIYAEGKKTMDGIEEEIRLLLEKHMKVALMTNSSIASVVRGKGRMLTNEELLEKNK